MACIEPLSLSNVLKSTSPSKKKFPESVACSPRLSKNSFVYVTIACPFSTWIFPITLLLSSIIGLSVVLVERKNSGRSYVKDPPYWLFSIAAWIFLNSTLSFRYLVSGVIIPFSIPSLFLSVDTFTDAILFFCKT